VKKINLLPLGLGVNKLIFQLLTLALVMNVNTHNIIKIIMNTALLIIDIQNDYFTNGAMELVNSDQASLNARQIINKFRNENLPVIHIQHFAVRSDATFLRPNTKGVEIHENVKPLEHEKVIKKHYPNSFRETELLEYLKSINVTNLVICGMMTHMCVDTTVRAAKDYGFNCTLIGDACATKDLIYNGQIVKANDVQNSFLAALSYFFAKVITTEQYLTQK
jgi:nicotinamidase-related amidase